MPRLFALLLGFALVTQLCVGAAAETLLPSIQRIVDRGVLVIAVVEVAHPPMIERDKQGRFSGFDVELGKDIARALGVKADFFVAGPRREDVIDVVASGAADIGLSYLAASFESARRVFFTEPYMIERHTVFVNRIKGLEYGDHCPSISDLRRMARTRGSLGLRRNSRYENLIKATEPEAKPVRFDNTIALMDAVNEGGIVASLQGEVEAKHYLSHEPGVVAKLKLCYVPEVRHAVAAAVRPDALDLARWLDLYIAKRGIIIDLDTVLYRRDLPAYWRSQK